MFRAALICVLGARGFSGQQDKPPTEGAKYRIVVKGKQTGEATLLQKLTPDGGKTLALTMTIRQGDDRVVVKTQTTYLPDGSVTHSEQKIFPFGKPPVKEVTADFDAAGVKLVTKEGGETTPSTAPRKASWPIANRSTFWFLNTTPEVGAEVRTFIFNLDTQKWERCVITFEGKTHKGSLVHMEKEGQTVETAYDDDGYPHSIESSGGAVLERD